MDAISRRDFFGDFATGLAGVGLASLLARDLLAQEPPAWTPGRGTPQYPARAKRVLQIFCPGAVSHVDFWDHKPELERMDGKPLPGEENMVSFQGKNGALMKSPWPFVPAGRSGKRISSLLPHMARHADDIAFIHSMVSKTNTHGPGCVFMNTGHATEGFPAAGSWVSHALGRESENLPGYVAIPDLRGEPPNGKANWSNGFLPAEHQGIVLAEHQPIRNLRPAEESAPGSEDALREFLAGQNARHARAHPGDSELQARMASYELAARMQLSAPEVTNLGSEPDSIQKEYGTADPNPIKASYARNCLLARRLLERGVRYVNLYCASRASGVDGLLNWDAHKTLKADYERHAPVFDQPTAALLSDLKRRGLLDETLVLWTTEFGRMPTHQAGTQGRDHNPDGFTCWMMGAGVKGGVSHGATDEFGRRSVDRIATVWDFYATVLHLLGLEHTRVTWYHNGLNRRLTDVHGHRIDAILA
ncbi:MAG: DUF1501 domain-containing protein [Planctomycetes bacterium]|nr:DUF1501 domain-containing protein [Planctomycetota bacterium]